MDQASLRHTLTPSWLTVRKVKSLATLEHYLHDIQYIPDTKNQATDALTKPLDIRWECCQVSQSSITQLLVQNLTEWLQEVTTEVQDDRCSEDIVQILEFEDSYDH